MNSTDKAQKVLILGSGVMGSSIAQVFATAGIDVSLVDVDNKALDRAMGLIESGLRTFADNGRLPAEKIPLALARIKPSTDLAGSTQGVQFVLEAVPEIPDLKRQVFSQLSDVCQPGTIIASNTSALDIFSIVSVKQPERLVIAHFFSPAHIIPLVEVVPGPGTSTETIVFTRDLLKRAGRSPVVMRRYGPGFIVNRIQKAIGETCLDLIDEGLATPEEIDQAVKLTLGVRLPIVGVVQTFDFQGLDMLLQYQRNVGKVYPFIEEKVKQGRLGVKTSGGIYDYQGRTETEILRKRDELYLKMMDHLEKIGAFEPV